MKDKICLVTGATAGIGAVTAEGLASRGATVVVAGRSREKCDATVAAIRERTGNSAVDSLVADLSSLAEVRRLANEFQDRYPRLDVLINNAGVLLLDRRESEDGYELTFAVNHLAPFLLTNLLLDTLRRSAPARIVNVASDAHRWAREIYFDDLQARKRFNGLAVYARSKLANILFTNELAKRLSGTGVTANSVHPGFVATNIFVGKRLGNIMMGIGARLFAVSPEKGARNSIYLATAPELENVTGAYFESEKPTVPAKAARDEVAARRLWEVSEELTGLRPKTDDRPA